jgi:thiopeptide-type bacteriocin biosynthesis protein
MSKPKYISVYIFYHTLDLRPVLLGCVDGLIQRLTNAGLISRFFFIRYWEEGTHVRLRVLPTSVANETVVWEEMERCVGTFLSSSPSLFDFDPRKLAPVMQSLYEFEKGHQAVDHSSGEPAEIKFRQNNSFHMVDYAPELDRYGGVFGIELAHEHFHISSVVALNILRDNKSRVRTSVLGLAFQIMLHFVYSFYEDRANVAAFFRQYRAFFGGLKMPAYIRKEFDRYFDVQAGKIMSYVADLENKHDWIKSGDQSELSRYIQHAYDLKAEIRRSYEARKLYLRSPADTYNDVLHGLLINYVHMLNNRLGVIIFEEVYLANLVAQALELEHV